ncbi:FAD-dependent oxidoreductase [Polluticoccus soli]|uniref:FAD-dependent oxidoreductase n=1 Tax=Polluticoccus soli TaxID=3034150 RepID=UPI0023E288B2|nr:NAD(P)/FAD-dependent oxidoreductase [Flavipsychrobacter sp. JY13-12]
MARSVTILGAGLVGSLLAIILRKRGYDVTIYERRPDMRSNKIAAGRSINLAMSARGWKALDLAGLRADLESIAIPMYGRYLHQADGSSAFQQYGKNNEAIYSVSRGELNKKLMTLAEREGATIHFEHRCTKVDVHDNRLHFQKLDGTELSVLADLLFGADGAFSALRSSYVGMERVNASQQYLEHGYKELSIPPDAAGKIQMEQHALHIWPRKNFMMIALPNTDGTFTCTLFFPFSGPVSFEKLTTKDEVLAFFKEQFPDAVPMMPTLLDDFFNNPTSSLITTHIFPWHHSDKSALIGDAAHAIVPFYGQGMNAGFEDCTILAGLMDQHGDNWDVILKAYEQKRKPNGDAVAQLALLNFVEMRDKVADPNFLERKKIEKELGKRYPDRFISVYEMVSFSHTPYNTALSCIRAQDQLLQNIMNEGNFFDNIEQQQFCNRLDAWMNDYHHAVQQLDFGNGAN